MARGHVVAWSHDANGNMMDKAHINPIIDNMMYQTAFTGGKVTELTAIIIANSIHSPCDADGNESLKC